MRFCLFAAGLLLAGQVHASSCKGMFPKNDLWIPATSVTAQGITEIEFNEVLQKVEDIFSSQVRAHGYILRIDRLWSDGTVNSDTYVQNNKWIIRSFGGLARYKGMTKESYAAVACHELGHHLGGAPLFSDLEWASIEGGSDYYSTLKCMRQYYAGDDNVKIVEGLTIAPTAKAKCEISFPNNVQEQAICKRITVAAQEIATVAADLGGDGPPSFDTPDPTVVPRMYEGHPRGQCRLDTLFRAAICTAPVNVELSQRDYRVGSCFIPGEAGLRPLCWFKP